MCIQFVDLDLSLEPPKVEAIFFFSHAPHPSLDGRSCEGGKTERQQI